MQHDRSREGRRICCGGERQCVENLRLAPVGFEYSGVLMFGMTRCYKALEMLTRWPLFRRERQATRAWDVIAWWESRRIPYNLIVGATGIASAIVMLLTGLVTEHIVGEAIDAQGSPIFEIVAVILYGIMVNICFTGGWVLELLSRRIWGTRAEAFGEIAFTWGTLFSVLLTLVPAALTIGVGACRILAIGRRNSLERAREVMVSTRSGWGIA
jgi:hypothetical protein